MGDQKQKKSNIGLIVVIRIGLLCLISFVWFLWRLYFKAVGNSFVFNKLWKGDSPRSALGDYFGGLLNPIFS